MSQTTSKGDSSVIPHNRDPRFCRPTYLSSSTDSILTQGISQPNDIINTNLDESVISRECDICMKVLPTKKGLRLHKIHCMKKILLSSNIDNKESENMPSSNVYFSIKNFAKQISGLKRNISILKRIPKGARNVSAEELSNRILECVNTNSQLAWFKLMLFSYECIRTPEKQDSRSLTSLVKINIASQTLPKVKERKKTLPSIQHTIIKKFEDFDLKGALRVISSNDSIADINDYNYTRLVTMHPGPSREIQLPQPPDSESVSLKIIENVVHNSILSFPNGSSSGIDGISPQHLKDLTSRSAGEQGVKLLGSITKLVNFMLEGKVNDEILKYLYGANLCALNKKDGGIRPIAVGCVFRRITAKICCLAVQDKCKEYFQPIQLGFATKQGCEAIIHAARTFIEHERLSNSVFIKIDYKNAFNSIERDVLLQQVKERVPELYPFLWQCYSSSSLLFFGKKTIYSQVGCQQGDPTSSLSFSLAIHPILTKLKSRLKLFYLDDGILAGDPDTVLEDLNLLIAESKKVGLIINPTKCELFFTSSNVDKDIEKRFAAVLPGFETVSYADLSLLGSPLCPEGFKSPMEERLNSLILMFERLKTLPKQISYFLLKNCLGIPKMLYTIRTVPTFMFPNCLRSMDDAIKSCLEEIMNVSLKEIQFSQASLPIHLGGVGIRSISDLSLPGFLSSCMGTLPLVSNILNIPVDMLVMNPLIEGMTSWNTKYNQIPINNTMQRQWDDIILKYKMCNEFKFENPKDIARLKAIQGKEAGAWLNAFPSRNIGTLMDDRTFQICAGLRLGCDLCRTFQCICGQVVDEKALHPLSCNKSSGRYFRHAEVNNFLKRAFASIDIPTQLEPSGLDRNDGKRPDGATIIPWTKGQCLVWDFTCSDTFAASYLNQTKEEAGAAAELAVKRKHAKYTAVKSRGIHLTVFGVETMGVWCREGKQLIFEIGNKLIQKTGDKQAKNYLIQKLSLIIQRGNAASILGSLPSGETLTDIFYL